MTTTNCLDDPKSLSHYKNDAVEDCLPFSRSISLGTRTNPTMRRRVITDDGAIHWLDAKTIADSPSAEYDANTFSDRRIVRAPLPAVCPGAVIEYEIILRETSALLDTGEARRITIFDGSLFNDFEFIEAAKACLSDHQQIDSRFGYAAFLSGGKTQFECDLGPLSPRKNLEGNLPRGCTNVSLRRFLHREIMAGSC